MPICIVLSLSRDWRTIGLFMRNEAMAKRLDCANNFIRQGDYVLRSLIGNWTIPAKAMTSIIAYTISYALSWETRMATILIVLWWQYNTDSTAPSIAVAFQQRSCIVSAEKFSCKATPHRQIRQSSMTELKKYSALPEENWLQVLCVALEAKLGRNKSSCRCALRWKKCYVINFIPPCISSCR